MGTGTLSIDLDAVAANWRALDAMSDACVQTGAVVKANAYGLGVDRVAPRLAAEGARSFFVAEASEGIQLRQVLGDGPSISVFAGHMAGDTEVIRDNALTPMLNSAEQVKRHFEALPGHGFGVQLDSGMNRLGMEPADWAIMRADLLEAGPSLVMSHLACADEPDHPQNLDQLSSFREMTEGVTAPRALSATGGTLLGPEYHFDLTRPGVGLYGGLPFEGGRPVVRLSLPVVQTRVVQRGESISYGATWVAEEPTLVATVSGGYADGLHRALTGDGRLWSGGTPCPILGRVTMDLICVDITALGGVPAELDVLCAEQGVDDLAEAAGTIGYEILTSLGPRYRRRYEGAA